MNKKQKTILAILILVHIVLIILTLSSKINALFNDASLRKGQAADFFAVYQAGYNASNEDSVYLDNEGVSTPYSYPFRYLPFIGYTLGVVLNLFSPFTAYYIWVVFYEILLIFNIYLTSKLTKSTDNFLLACVPWLIFTPYLLEIYMGQWSFLLTCLLFYSIFGLLNRNKLVLAYILAPLVKPNALILTPLFARFKEWKLLIVTFVSTLITSVPYFLIFKRDWTVFMNNFKDVISYHGGNLGFKSLYGLITVEYLSLPLPRLWFFGFVIASGLLTLYLTFKYKNVILSYALWMCYYFLIYKDVWEHHYVLIMPVFAFVIAKMNITAKQLFSKKYLPFLIAFLLIALPTPFIAQYLFAQNAPVEPDSLSPFFAIPYHFAKISGIILLYIWSAFKIRSD